MGLVQQVSPDDWPERASDMLVAYKVEILRVASLARPFLLFEVAIVAVGFWVGAILAGAPSSMWLVQAVWVTVAVGASIGWGFVPAVAWRRARKSARDVGLDLRFVGRFGEAIAAQTSNIGRPSVLTGHRNRPIHRRLREAPGRWGYILSWAALPIATGLREAWLTPMSFWFPGSLAWFWVWIGLATLSTCAVANGFVYGVLFWPLEELRLAREAVEAFQGKPVGW